MPDKFITLPQLTKTVKGLVNKMNAEVTIADSKIGDLSNLTTSATGNLVAAINEAASSGGATGDLSGYVQSQVGNDGTLYEDFIGSVIENNGNIYLAHLDSIQETEASISISQYGLDLVGMPDENKPVTIRGLAAPSDNYDAVNKQYVDTIVANAAQVNSDWNATSGVAQILNKPIISSWALAANKPTYTATEVGAVPSTFSSLSLVSRIKNNGNIEISESDSGGEGSASLTMSGSNVILQSSKDLTNSSIKLKTNDVENISLSEGQTTIIGVVTPTSDTMAANKQYVDQKFNNITHPVTSVNGVTGAVIIDKIKTTAPSNNVEYNLMGTTSNNNTIAVSPYNQDLLKFAKTTDLSRLTIGSTATPGVVRIYTSAANGTGFTDIKSNASSTNERTITLPDASGTVALITDIPNVPSWALNSTKPSYTFSELTSHPTTLNDYGITNAYTKTEVDGLVSGVLHYKGAKSTTGALPSSGNTTGDVWHVTADGSEWAWDGSTWQELGTAIDLSGYLQTGDIAAWAKAANKPTYTASEVGALPSSTSYVSSFNGATGAITYTAPVTSVNGNTGAVTITAASITAASATHAHGNITSGGDMTATAAIASGDRLVINDESASKITNSSITFGSSTTQYLANNGTWQNAYDDTALAARVTALEQIPWVTYYTGSTTPTNAQGNNGDLYFQTSQ